MRKKLTVFFILLLLFGAGIAAKFLLFDRQITEGKLQVLSSPTAALFLNNASLGKTPYEDKVRAGEYILKLIPESTATNVASWQGKITIYQNTLTYIDRELAASDLTSSGVIFTTAKMKAPAQKKNTGEVAVETEPNGAIAYLDNDEKGVTPLILANVPQGEHELSVYSPGFFKRTQRINVEADYRTIGVIKLALDQSQKKLAEIPEEATESAELIGETEKKTATSSAKTKTPVIVVILDTPTGWLRVRTEPSLTASEAAKVKPKDTFELLEEKDDWYKISYAEGKEGWVSAQYAQKKEPSE